MSQPLFKALLDRFKSLEADLNALDAATGDGDHGSTMLKGLQAVVDDDLNPAKSFRRAAGGASGSIFSVLIATFDQCDDGQAGFGQSLQAAAVRIAEMGQAAAGDKTMLDALLPAAEAATIADAAKAAREGAEATRDMAARRGRAKYVEGKGVGHIDAGAVSVAEMLDVLAACRAGSKA